MGEGREGEGEGEKDRKRNEESHGSNFRAILLSGLISALLLVYLERGE
jgi:hypothetical protein